MDNATLYAHSNGLQKRDALIVLREFIPRMSWNEDTETVLDIGCGSGDVTRNLLLPLLPPSVEKIVAVDVSQEMVNFASKHFQHNQIEYQQMDIASLSQNPYQMFPNRFSKITSFYCLHWIREQATCLENIYNLLQENGEVLLVFLASNPIFTMYENMSLKDEWKDYMKDVSNYVPVQQHKQFPEEDFRTIAEEVGFEVSYCEAPEMQYTFQNINQLKAAIEAVNPFLKAMPTNLREKFIRECLEGLIKLSPKNEEGSVVAKYNILVCCLRKTF